MISLSRLTFKSNPGLFCADELIQDVAARFFKLLTQHTKKGTLKRPTLFCAFTRQHICERLALQTRLGNHTLTMTSVQRTDAPVIQDFFFFFFNVVVDKFKSFNTGTCFPILIQTLTNVQDH